jgi:hypothetical protein
MSSGTLTSFTRRIASNGTRNIASCSHVETGIPGEMSLLQNDFKNIQV